MQVSALRTRLSAALLEFAWDEWAQMGLLAAAPQPRPWAQDPEALLLLTLEVGRDDPRLFDEMLDWLVRNEPLMSARRLRTLSHGPDDERLASAAMEWVTRERRPRAKPRGQPTAGTSMEPLFRSGDLPSPRNDPVFAAFGFARPPAQVSGKSREPDPNAPINFAFRLRRLLGVGTRAEAIRYLLTAEIQSATVSEVAAPSGYAKRNIQEALASLHAAGVVTLVGNGGEQRFAVDRARWAYLLGLERDRLPLFRDWPTLLGALRRILRWLTDPELEGRSDYLRASQAADLLDEVRPMLTRAGVLTPGRLDGERSWSDLENAADDALRSLAPPSSLQTSPATFQIAADATGGHHWRLTTTAGRIVATSAEAYSSDRAARAAVERMREAPGPLSLAVMRDAGAYRWRVDDDHGRTLAVSSESFATTGDAERAARDAHELIAGAVLPHSDTRRPRSSRAAG